MANSKASENFSNLQISPKKSASPRCQTLFKLPKKPLEIVLDFLALIHYGHLTS